MVNIIKDKEEVKSVMNIIQAFADGKTIQAIDPYDDEWCDQTKLNFEALFEGQYRIKPEPTYRPFKDAEECWTEMLKHQPFGWVKSKEDGSRSLITLIISEENIDINCIGGFNSDKIMKRFTFDDGAVFGILEEE